jgi:hypothetical protein
VLFEASFAGENATLQEEADTTNPMTSSPRAHETAENSRKRQRASTSATNDRQRGKTRCAACDRLHDISKCWLVIEAIRPPDWKPSQRKVDEFEKRLKEQKSLAQLVERVRKEHLDQA